MANPDHLNMLRQGVDAWNAWREREPSITPDLSGAHLSEANLFGAHLSGADLRGAHLSGANLTGADLAYTSLVDADIRNADLTGCRIYGVSAWGLKLNDETRQQNLVIARTRDEPRSRSTISKSHNLFT